MQEQAPGNCPRCSLLLKASSSTLQQHQQFDPVVAAAVLADQLQRCKQKLSAKRQLVAQLQDTNSELVEQLVELKAANAALSSKLAALTAVQTSSVHNSPSPHTKLTKLLSTQQHISSPIINGSSPHIARVTAPQAAGHTTWRSPSRTAAQHSIRGLDIWQRPATAEGIVAGHHQSPADTATAESADGYVDWAGGDKHRLVSSCCRALDFESDSLQQGQYRSQPELQQELHLSADVNSQQLQQQQDRGTKQYRPSDLQSSPESEGTAQLVRHRLRNSSTPTAQEHCKRQQKKPEAETGEALGHEDSSSSHHSNDLADNDIAVAAQQYTEQVLQDLGLSSQEQQQDGLWVEHQSIPSEDRCTTQHQHAQQLNSAAGQLQIDADSSSTSSTLGADAATQQRQQRRPGRQQQHAYVVQRTGGGYMPGQLSPAEELMQTAAVYRRQKGSSKHQQSQNTTPRRSSSSAANAQPEWNDSTIVHETNSSSKPHRTAEQPRGLNAALQTLARHQNSNALLLAAQNSSSNLGSCLPPEAISVMQDFYRQHCCVEWPLVKAARNCSNACSPVGVSKNGSAAAAAAAAGVSGNGSGEVGIAFQPLVPWQVLERLLLLLDKAFRQRERTRLAAQKSRHDKQLTVMKRQIIGAKSLPQVLQHNEVQHLKAQLNAARQSLAARDNKQHAAVVKAAEHGYHIGRQLDLVTAEAAELQQQLTAAAQQCNTLIEKVAEAFISGAHWKASQVLTILDQFEASISECEQQLVAAAADSDECCWEGVCPGVLRVARVQQRALTHLWGVLGAAWKVVID